MSHKPTQKEAVRRCYSDAALAARRAAQREWRAKNKDKCEEYRRRYWEKKAREANAACVEGALIANDA